MGTLFVDKLDPQSGTSLELGSSGDTITISSGATITNNGTQTGFGGVNTPAFEAFSTSQQAVNDNTTTKVECGTEVYDTAGAYDNSSNYRFTPQTAGRYFFYGQTFIITAEASRISQATAYIYKNGSALGAAPNSFYDNQIKQFTATVRTVINMNGSSDYVELYAYFDGNNYNGIIDGNASQRRTMFGGYKLII